MKMTNFKKALSLFVCIVLIAAMALFTAGCNDNNNTAGGTEAPSSSESSSAGKTVLGDGATVFDFTVVDKDGKETAFEIHTDKKTVGDALLELKLIAGDAGDYGLYVKTVNGITVDYDTDGKYWAFYVDGQYGATGVDSTEITAGSTYAFKVE